MEGDGRLVTSVRLADSNLKLRVEDATKYYATRTGPVHAVENVSFDVREGEMMRCGSS
jgi:ABC-type glutathione transport system ATPase component